MYVTIEISEMRVGDLHNRKSMLMHALRWLHGMFMKRWVGINKLFQQYLFLLFLISILVFYLGVDSKIIMGSHINQGIISDCCFRLMHVGDMENLF